MAIAELSAHEIMHAIESKASPGFNEFEMITSLEEDKHNFITSIDITGKDTNEAQEAIQSWIDTNLDHLPPFIRHQHIRDYFIFKPHKSSLIDGDRRQIKIYQRIYTQNTNISNFGNKQNLLNYGKFVTGQLAGINGYTEDFIGDSLIELRAEVGGRLLLGWPRVSYLWEAASSHSLNPDFARRFESAFAAAQRNHIGGTPWQPNNQREGVRTVATKAPEDKDGRGMRESFQDSVAGAEAHASDTTALPGESTERFSAAPQSDSTQKGKSNPSSTAISSVDLNIIMMRIKRTDEQALRLLKSIIIQFIAENKFSKKEPLNNISIVQRAMLASNMESEYACKSIDIIRNISRTDDLFEFIKRASKTIEEHLSLYNKFSDKNDYYSASRSHHEDINFALSTDSIHEIVEFARLYQTGLAAIDIANETGIAVPG